MIGFEPGILSLASRALIGADLAGADPTGLLLPAPLAGKLGLPGGKPAGIRAWVGPRPLPLPFLPLRVFFDDLVALRLRMPGSPMPPS